MRWFSCADAPLEPPPRLVDLRAALARLRSMATLPHDAAILKRRFPAYRVFDDMIVLGTITGDDLDPAAAFADATAALPCSEFHLLRKLLAHHSHASSFTLTAIVFTILGLISESF